MTDLAHTTGSGSASPTAIEAWARLATATPPAASIDAAALAHARVALLDLLGVTLAGSATAIGRIAGDHAAALGGPPDARILGRAARVAAVNAAFANGVAGHALELDDGHAPAAGHPGVVVVPAALAVSGPDTTYGDLLRAVVLGYELFAGVGAALNPGHLRRGFHTTATIGPLAGALAAGAVRGLDAAQLTAALGLAGLQGAGLFEAAHGGRGAKPFQVGRATSAAVTAVHLAEAGLAGPATVLEGEAGFLHAMGDGPADAGPPAGLGAERAWAIHGIYLKRHPACRHTHPAIDVALDVHARLGEAAARIERVTVETYATAGRLCGIAAPADAEQTRFSIPFLVATALATGRLQLADLVPLGEAGARVRELTGRVGVTVADDLEARYPAERVVRVAVELPGGESFAVERAGAVGDPDRPLSPEDVREKFSSLAAAALPAERAGELGRALLAASPEEPLAGLLAALDAA